MSLPNDLHQLSASDPGRTPAEQHLVEAVATWLRTVIAHPHPQLGRPGDVCPFVDPALNRFHSIFVHLYRGDATPEALIPVLRRVAACRQQLPPASDMGSNFRAILMLFPGVALDAGPWLIDPVQQALKAEITASGWMLGQFYPGCPEPGLHNPDFRPLDAPVPMMVIRPMQVTDLMFLVSRPEYLRAYCDRFQVANRQQVEDLVAREQLPQLPRDWQATLDLVFPR